MAKKPKLGIWASILAVLALFGVRSAAHPPSTVQEQGCAPGVFRPAVAPPTFSVSGDGASLKFTVPASADVGGGKHSGGAWELAFLGANDAHSNRPRLASKVLPQGLDATPVELDYADGRDVQVAYVAWTDNPSKLNAKGEIEWHEICFVDRDGTIRQTHCSDPAPK